jgi:hypothetical protein
MEEKLHGTDHRHPQQHPAVGGRGQGSAFLAGLALRGFHKEFQEEAVEIEE